MSDRPRISIELVKPAGFRTQEKLRDRSSAGLWKFLTDEYRLTGSLTEEQKESYRDHPEEFIRAEPGWVPRRPGYVVSNLHGWVEPAKPASPDPAVPESAVSGLLARSRSSRIA